MKPIPAFVVHCAELLAPAGSVRTARMFSGWGLYLDEVFVAIVIGEVLYLKADGQSRPQFEAAGGHRFQYTRQGKTQDTGFWTVPAEAMDSPALMQPWARLAVQAALRSRAGSRRR
ncbi:TfoX/Sxy family protein [Ramlibacter sp. AW1]|uniref:TfoX/Sxy family protein n=1 Tax=Ramlibacter aurantiacus TaxID=2801330 RepID=A0A936ZQC6_9BURK|nr:TfoX/Sxy family protein [Ramlibacter aurantiacus]MBL0419070.1 TfoX/Sxy family protein [Ramlibacter aurantiacus]